MNHTYLLVSGILLSVLSIQPIVTIDTRWEASATVGQRSITLSDSVKKQPNKLRTSPVKQTSSAPYSAAGHYTVTVPRENGPGAKADLILVNGTKQVERIGDVDSNDIESIQVFRDAKTIAKYKIQYGEKADKGVVIIQLKHKTL